MGWTGLDQGVSYTSSFTAIAKIAFQAKHKQTKKFITKDLGKKLVLRDDINIIKIAFTSYTYGKLVKTNFKIICKVNKTQLNVLANVCC